MSPALILRKDRGELHIPCKQPVCDGRSAKERMETGERICSVVFTNKDASLVCCITDSGDEMESCLFLKGRSGIQRTGADGSWIRSTDPGKRQEEGTILMPMQHTGRRSRI